MPKSTKKKPLVLEPDEDVFYYQFQTELERITTAFADVYNTEENQSVIDDRIEAELESSRSKLRNALLVLLTAYYIKGTRRAEKQLGEQPVIFTTEDTAIIGIISRNAEDVVDSILSELKNTMVEGLSIEAREEYLKNVRAAIIHAQNRARMMAATESMFARNEAMLSAYRKRGGIFFVRWIAIKDERLCPICSAGMDKIYRIEEAYALIPAHPYCRCEWFPITKLEEVL